MLGAHFIDPSKQHIAGFVGFALMQSAFYSSVAISGAHAGASQRALCVGLGSGTVPTFGRNIGWAIDVVELRPSVIKIAATNFGYNACTLGKLQSDVQSFSSSSPKKGLFSATAPCFDNAQGSVLDLPENTTCAEYHGRTIHADAYSWLYGDRMRTSKSDRHRYCLIILDVFDGTNTDTLQIITLERLQLLKERWLPRPRTGGASSRSMVVVNVVGYIAGPHSLGTLG